MSSMKKFLKISINVFAWMFKATIIFIFIASVAFFWMFEIAGKDVEQFCQLAQSKTFGDLEKLTNHFNLLPNNRLNNYVNKEGRIIFHTPRSYGRHTCAVEIKNNQIVKATFNFLD